MGWGQTSYDPQLGSLSPQSDVLNHVVLTVSHTKAKNWLYTKVGNINGNPQNPCSGDSGGPLVYKDPGSGRWTIIGTVYGGGYNCNNGYGRNGEGKWNKVTAHLTWIKNIIDN